jgi:hypothetical protein
LLATHCERDFRIHPCSVCGNQRLLTVLKRFLAFWRGWNSRHRRTSTGRDRPEQFTFSWQFCTTLNRLLIKTVPIGRGELQSHKCSEVMWNVSILKIRCSRVVGDQAKFLLKNEKFPLLKVQFY